MFVALLLLKTKKSKISDILNQIQFLKSLILYTNYSSLSNTIHDDLFVYYLFPNKYKKIVVE